MSYGQTPQRDADHAGCKDDCKSTSGGLQFLGGKLVSWSSKKQDCTVMSTVEAKYVSLSACCAQVIWMRTQLLNYGYKYNQILMYYDSKSATAISCNPVQHSKTKHINIRYHFIKEHVEKGTVEIYFVGTEYQLADLFTKALPKERFEYLVHRIVNHEDAYDSDVDEGPNAAAAFMANCTSPLSHDDAYRRQQSDSVKLSQSFDDNTDTLDEKTQENQDFSLKSEFTASLQNDLHQRIFYGRMLKSIGLKMKGEYQACHVRPESGFIEKLQCHDVCSLPKELSVGKVASISRPLEMSLTQLKDALTSVRIQIDGYKTEIVNLKDVMRMLNLSLLNVLHSPAKRLMPNCLLVRMPNLKTKPGRMGGKKIQWVKPTPLPKKKQVTFQEPPRTSNRPTQKPPVQQNKKPNVSVNLSTRTKPATESRKPMPKCHTRNHHPLGKFDGKADEGFLVGYSINSKAFRVFNTRTRKVEENLHITFLENKPNVVGSGDDDLSKRNGQEKEEGASNKEDDQHVQDFRAELDNFLVQQKEGFDNADDQERIDSSTQDVNTAGPSINTSSENINTGSSNINTTSPIPNDPSMQSLEATGIFNDAYDDREEVGAEANLNNLVTTMNVSSIPTTRIHKDHPIAQIIGDLHLAPLTIRMSQQNLEELKPKKVIQTLTDPSRIEAMQEELLQFKLQKVWTLVDLPKGKRTIGTKWVYRNKKDERGIVVRNKARLVAQGYTQEEGIHYDEVFAPVARIEAIRLFLAYASFIGLIVYQMDVKSAFLYGTIEEEVYVCQPPSFEDPQFPDKVYKVYVDDIIFGSTKKSLCVEFEQMMHKRFQISSMGELTFFLGLQVQQKEEGIFISQDKYVADILKKFDFTTIKAASTPIETNKALNEDEEAEDVDVHLYRSMIGSLMYLTASRPDIMFAVYACARDSPFDLEAFSDSDYAGASLDRKSTIRGCQFLGKRLISWQCKKQTIVANSTTEAKYVAAANCCGQVLWIQNQMLDYGFNFMNTKIHIDNESTIGIVKNPVFHSKTKHIEIRHHFIRDSYEKKLIQVIKIHTDHNVADLLIKAFDVSRKAKRTTKISQSSRPIHLVADETVYKEWEDRMERAATTASSLEVEQDSGSGPRCQDTILRGAEAQIREIFALSH
ncbi:putative ribonuclease H-like domain-containing protein [Tanacetum coccineum]